MKYLARSTFSLLVGASLLAAACAQDKPRGGLVISIDSNVSVPKDINGLGLAVAVAGQVKFSYVYGVSPDGKVTLPATLVLEEPLGGGAPPVNVRITAFKGGQARIVRDAITTIPHTRVASMRLQLSVLGLDDGVTGTIDPNNVERILDPSQPATLTTTIHLDDTIRPEDTTGSFDPFMTISSKCSLAANQGDIDGLCQDATIDSATLPDYVPIAAGAKAPCFDVGGCFSAAKQVTLGPGCTFPFTGDASTLNVALLTKGAGFLTSLGYLAPLDNDPVHGFAVSNGVVTLPKGVCANNPNVRGVVIQTNGCTAKSAGIPLLGAGASCSFTGADGGTPGP